MRQTAVNKFRNNARLRTAKTVDKAKFKAPHRSMYILFVVKTLCSGCNTLSDTNRNNLTFHCPENLHFIQHSPDFMPSIFHPLYHWGKHREIGNSPDAIKTAA